MRLKGCVDWHPLSHRQWGSLSPSGGAFKGTCGSHFQKEREAQPVLTKALAGQCRLWCPVRPGGKGLSLCPLRWALRGPLHPQLSSGQTSHQECTSEPEHTDAVVMGMWPEPTGYTGAFPGIWDFVPR